LTLFEKTVKEINQIGTDYETRYYSVCNTVKTHIVNVQLKRER